LSGRDGNGTLSPSYRACVAGFDDFLKVFFTVLMHRTLASGALTRPISSGRSTCERAKRAAGRGTPACPMHFCCPPDAVRQHLAEVTSARRGGKQSYDVLTRRWARPISTHRTRPVKDFARGPLLETTRRHVDQRPVISTCASGVACT
jgi:hypothetical protein